MYLHAPESSSEQHSEDRSASSTQRNSAQIQQTRASRVYWARASARTRIRVYWVRARNTNTNTRTRARVYWARIRVYWARVYLARARNTNSNTRVWA